MGGTGWRRAFCTTIPRSSSDSPVLGDRDNSSRSSARLPFFKTTSSSSSNSTPRSRWSRTTNNILNVTGDDEETTATPRLRLRPKPNNADAHNDTGKKFHSSVIDNLNITPRLRCKTTNPKSTSLQLGSNPSSPRSPFSIFKTSLRFSRSNCGLCLQSVKTGHKTAIFTAECSHTFHFPCISQHVKHENLLACPVCKTTWRDGSFLRLQHNHQIHNKPTITTNDNENLIPSPSPSPRPKPKPKAKAYDDDEPLGTPRAAGILPIPEEDAADKEEEQQQDEEEEEFQGFFAYPASNSSSHDDLKNVEVMLLPQVALISSNQSHHTYALLLKVKAPPPHMLNASRRAPIDLVAVLDVSASMGGPKLQMLKRAMRLVISSLGSADRLSIVAFSACPKRLLPLRRMHPRGQRAARRIIDQLTCSRGTCAGDALRKATKVLEDRRERNPVATIILLSDGHEDHSADSNQQRQASGHVSSTRFAHVEIPVHTLEKGSGAGGYDNDEPAENAFSKCVGGLLSVVAQDLRVEVGVGAGSDPAEITGVYSCNGRPVVLNSTSVRLGDLYAEEEREVLLELRVPTSSTGHHVLSARCSYKDPATQQLLDGGEKALLVPRPQPLPSSNVQRLRNLFIATRAVAESRLLRQHNHLTTARQLLSSARALLMHSPSAQDLVKGLDSELLDVHEWRLHYHQAQGLMMDHNANPLTPTSPSTPPHNPLPKVNNPVADLHGFENARF